MDGRMEEWNKIDKFMETQTMTQFKAPDYLKTKVKCLKFVFNITQGRYCHLPCEKNKYGRSCGASCNCDQSNTRSCHHVTGECECLPGFKAGGRFVKLNLKKWFFKRKNKK